MSKTLPGFALSQLSKVTPSDILQALENQEAEETSELSARLRHTTVRLRGLPRFTSPPRAAPARWPAGNFVTTATTCDVITRMALKTGAIEPEHLARLLPRQAGAAMRAACIAKLACTVDAHLSSLLPGPCGQQAEALPPAERTTLGFLVAYRRAFADAMAALARASGRVHDRDVEASREQSAGPYSRHAEPVPEYPAPTVRKRRE